ncbi:MAG TPA: putative ABC transporter permease [Spirochaetota bacterium]|nr:putative ABC transporter permease [Spirochaetota bacterium]
MELTLHQGLFLFTVFSFFGWILETGYRSVTQKMFVNPGFLKGPFVPLYGLSGLMILVLHGCIHEQPLVIRFFTYALVISMAEYFVGEFLLIVFRKRYWDYTNDFFNVQGHICITFSILWGVLSVAGEMILFPMGRYLLGMMDEGVIYFAGVSGITIMAVDLTMTLGVPRALRGMTRKSISILWYMYGEMSEYKNMLLPVYGTGGPSFTGIRREIVRAVQRKKEGIIQSGRDISLSDAAALIKRMKNVLKGMVTRD